MVGALIAALTGLFGGALAINAVPHLTKGRLRQAAAALSETHRWAPTPVHGVDGHPGPPARRR